METGKYKSAAWASQLNVQEANGTDSLAASSQRPRRVIGANEVWRPTEGNPGDRRLHIKSKGRPKEALTLKNQYFCSIQYLNWLNEAHSYYGSQSTYLNFTDLNIILSQKHHPSWHIKLIITMLHLSLPSLVTPIKCILDLWNVYQNLLLFFPFLYFIFIIFKFWIVFLLLYLKFHLYFLLKYQISSC